MGSASTGEFGGARLALAAEGVTRTAGGARSGSAPACGLIPD